MKIVLYTEDLEPITVIDLPMWGIDRLKEGYCFSVPVIEPVEVMLRFDPLEKEMRLCQSVTIWAEKFVRKDVQTWMMFTRDEELALKLFGEPLPGQERGWQEQYKKGFISGLLQALS